MAQYDHQNDIRTGTTYCYVSRLIDVKTAAKFIGIVAMLALSISAQANEKRINSATPVDMNASNAAIKNISPEATTDRIDLKASSVAFNALANDADADGDRLMIIEATAKFGAVAFTPEGLLAYAQNPGPARADKITYIVSDGRGGLDQGVVEIMNQ